MEFTAKLSNLRTAPRKARLVVDLVRGKTVPQAQSILLFTVNKTARPVLKLLNSAADSAKHNQQINAENLFISKITVDEGPKLKRWHPMSRGRAYPIIKRSCRIALVLSEIAPTEKKPTTISPKASLDGKPVKTTVKKTVKKKTVKK